MPSRKQTHVFRTAISLLLLLVPGAAYAAPTPSQTFIELSAQMTGFLIVVLNFFAWLSFSVLDLIMRPEFIFQMGENGTEGPLLQMLRTIWQFTRDLVNLGFAVALIAGAIIMIVTADGSKVKEHLPKFVMALVLVNMSWFIPRVIFDISQVLTYTVYQIPSLLGAEGCTVPAGQNDTGPQQCKMVMRYKFLNDTTTIGNGVDNTDGSSGWSCPISGIVCIQTVDMNQGGNQVNSHSKVLNGLIVNHARLQFLSSMNLQTPPVLPNVGALEAGRRMFFAVLKMVVVLMIHIAIVFPLVAMTAAFFIRIPVLWVTMAFMPAVALGYIFDQTKEIVEPIQKQFLQAVFLPMKVAIPFTVGFILINAGAQTAAPPGFATTVPIFQGVNDYWQLTWMLIALFVIWKYSFDQLKPDKAGVLGHFTERIQGFGSSLGQLALKAPLAAPIIPAGRDSTGGQRPNTSILALAQNLSPSRQLANLRNFGTFNAGAGATGAGGAGGAGAINAPAAPQAVVKAITTNLNQTTNITNQLNKVFSGPTGPTEAAATQGIQQALQQLRTSPLGTNAVLTGSSNAEVLRGLVQAAGLPADVRNRVNQALQQNQQNIDLANRNFGTP